VELLQQLSKCHSQGAEAATERSVTIPVSSTSPPTRIRTLAAEDSEDNRFLLEAYCGGSIYDLTFAFNGQRALEMFTSETFDLVIMDIQMPVMDGLTATTKIRDLEAARGSKRIPIIAMTANALPEDVTKAIDAGCDAHIPKPVSKKRFLNILDQWHSVSQMSGSACPIDIPDGLEILARSYLETRQRELLIFESLLADENFDAIGRLAHDLKGTGASYGFQDITRLGKTMEVAAKAKNASQLSRLLEELCAYIQQVVNHVGVT
jgi:CheY-like chemotaxis protein